MAQRPIVWLPEAATDLEEATDYVSKDSVTGARSLASQVLRAVDGLETFPEAGRVVPEWEMPEYRQIPVLRYRIIYRLYADRVVIYAIWYSARRLKRDVKERGKTR